MSTVLPILVVALVSLVMLGGRMLSKRAMGGLEAQYAHARAGAVAERMGLQLTVGDPQFNFYLNPRLKSQHEALHSIRGVTTPECEVRIEGAPGGRRVQLRYYDKMNLERGVLERTLHVALDARLSLAVNAPFPAFELYSRHPNESLKPEPQTSFPNQSLGDPLLDAGLILKSGDPRIGPVIAPSLTLLVQTTYVHILGNPGELTFRYTQMGTMMMGDADKLLPTMLEMVLAIERAAAAHTATAPAS